MGGSPYDHQKLEGMSGIETVSQSFFVMARLMREMTKAFQSQKYERTYLLGEQVRKILVLLEISFQEKKDPQLEGVIKFILGAGDCLKQILIKSDQELSTVLEKGFKDFAVKLKNSGKP